MLVTLATDVPTVTAAAIAIGGLLVGLSCMMSRLSGVIGVPISLVFLIIGMFAGSEALGGINFDNYRLAYICGTIALVVILFDGGLNTPIAGARKVLGPAVTLATAGVAIVAGVTAVGAKLLGLDWPTALLFGAIVSSTDAAAVFAVLRDVSLRERVRMTIELESGLNDPMAVILATAMTAHLINGAPLDGSLIPLVLWQLFAGGLAGVGIGFASRVLLRKTPVSTPGLYPVMTLGLAMLAYGVPQQFNGSGFMSVYVAGIVIGNGHVPYKTNLAHVHDSLAWLAQVGMFLLLGLLIFPSQLPPVAGLGVGLALIVALVSRPIAVTACLLPFKFNWREIVCIAWLGLRGAVPVIIATVPILAATADHLADDQFVALFNLVFFVVVVGLFVPGGMVAPVIRGLKLADRRRPKPTVELDIASSKPLDAVHLSLFVETGSRAIGRTLSELAAKDCGDDGLPCDAVVMMIVRGASVIAPRGGTRIEAGDHVHLFCSPRSEGAVRQAFGA